MTDPLTDPFGVPRDEGTYNASLLQVPALGVRALWLRHPSGQVGDILVLVTPVRSELVAEPRYTLAEFTDALKDAAAKILRDNDPRKEGVGLIGSNSSANKEPKLSMAGICERATSEGV